MLLAECWTWDVDPVLFPIIGPLKIRWYGLAFLGVFYFGYLLLSWQFLRGGLKDGKELASRFVNWAVVGVIAGSWFGHRFFYEFDRVLNNPLYLIDIRKGLAGLSSHGATVGCITILILFGLRYRIPVGDMFDRFMWSCAMGAVMVRLGNFFNSEIVGRPADVPWAVCLPRHDPQALVPRHPSQLYEVANGLIILGLLTLVDRLAGKEKRPRWLITGTFFTSYFVLRFLVEFFKDHQTLDSASKLTMGQYLSIPFALFGVTMIVYSLVKREPALGMMEPPPPVVPVDGESPSRPTPSAKRKKKQKRKRK